MVRPPILVTSPRTRTIGTPASAPWAAFPFGRCASDMELGEQDGETGVQHEDQEDRAHHRRSRVMADAFGAALHFEAAVTPDHRDDEGEERRLDDAEPEGQRIERAMKLIEEHGRGDVERDPAHDAAADDADEI